MRSSILKEERAKSESLNEKEMESFFNEHITRLVEHYRQDFKSMLEECKTISVASDLDEIKPKLQGDARFNRLPSKERKRIFERHLSDLIGVAKRELRRVLESRVSSVSPLTSSALEEAVKEEHSYQKSAILAGDGILVMAY